MVVFRSFKEIEDQLDAARGHIEQYTSSIHALFRVEASMAALVASPAPLSSLSTTQGLSASLHGPKKVTSEVVHATLMRGFEEFFTQPLKDAARHTEELRKAIKRRHNYLLDYEHHKRKFEGAHGPSTEHQQAYDKAALLIKEASRQLKLQLIAHDEAFSQLLQSLAQGFTASQLFYNRAMLSKAEGTPLDQGLRQTLESTIETLHPETSRYLSWLKSNAFAIQESLNPQELGGCVTPFDVVVASMLDALTPKPGLVFGKPLSTFTGT
jgi:hypothetical protein